MPSNMLRQVLAAVLILTGFAAAASAEVKLAAIFGDHMVLQRKMKTLVWGTAEPGEKIVIALGPYRTEATADAGGCWTARLGPMKAGGPLAMTVTGKNTVTLKDVLVGEVWFCSGQSNLGNLPSVINAAQEQAAAKYPNMLRWRSKASLPTSRRATSRERGLPARPTMPGSSRQWDISSRGTSTKPSTSRWE